MSNWFHAVKGAEVLLGNLEQEELLGLSYDSRKAKAGDLFLCMQGTTMDSHIIDSHCTD